MPLPAWPGTLPQKPLRNGYGLSSPADHMVESEVEDGPPLRRRQRLDLWSEIRVAYRMTAAQKAAFDTFWLQNLNAGTLDFEMPVWLLNGAGYVTRRVRIAGGTYSSVPAGPSDVVVSFSLKVRA